MNFFSTYRTLAAVLVFVGMSSGTLTAQHTKNHYRFFSKSRSIFATPSSAACVSVIKVGLASLLALGTLYFMNQVDQEHSPVRGSHVSKQDLKSVKLDKKKISSIDKKVKPVLTPKITLEELLMRKANLKKVSEQHHPEQKEKDHDHYNLKPRVRLQDKVAIEFKEVLLDKKQQLKHIEISEKKFVYYPDNAGIKNDQEESECTKKLLHDYELLEQKNKQLTQSLEESDKDLLEAHNDLLETEEIVKMQALEIKELHKELQEAYRQLELLNAMHPNKTN